MANLYMNPVAYGTERVTLPGGEACEIVYPADMDDWEGPIRPGTYPLMVFAHGDRRSVARLCPPDTSMDYWRWGLTLRYLARSGIVVAIPDVSGLVHDPQATADCIEETIDWLHYQWSDRANLWFKNSVIAPDLFRSAESKTEDQAEPLDPRQFAMLSFGEVFGVDVTAPGGLPTRVGVAGHSWGARGAAIAAHRQNRRIDALASVAGTWDDNESIQALTHAVIPTFMIAGTEAQIDTSYLRALWSSLAPRKHQAQLLGVGHWDWIPAISLCDGTPRSEAASHAYLAMSELLLTFMTKYIGRQWRLPPDLIGPPGDRAEILPFFEDGTGALAARWDDDPLEGTNAGEIVYGDWDSTLAMWD